MVKNVIPYTRIRPAENLVTQAVITQEMAVGGGPNVFEDFVTMTALKHIGLIKNRAGFLPRMFELNFERWDDPLRNQTKIAIRWTLKNAVGDRVVLVGGPADQGDKVLAVPWETREVVMPSGPSRPMWEPADSDLPVPTKNHLYLYAGYAEEERARAFTYRGLR